MLQGIKKSFIVFGAAFGLSACNGGGEAVPPMPFASPPTGIAFLDRSFVQSFAAFEGLARSLRDSDARYLAQWRRWSFVGAPGTIYDSYPLASARVEYAHAAGLTGAGQTVAIVDDGVLRGHGAFAATDIGTVGTVGAQDHGTAVASVIAGASDRMIGVAPGATLLIGTYASSTTLARATEAATAAGAVVQNNSWGYPLAATEGGFDQAFSTGSGAEYFAALRAFVADNVVVFAVANTTGAGRSDLMDALPVLRPELEGGWIAVASAVAEFDNSRILSAQLVSMPCGAAARWCLVAEGAWTGAEASGPAAYDFSAGSSFAAPQVSGAIALLAEAFPDLTPHQLRLRLLASADNGFFTPDAEVDLAPGPETYLRGYSTDFGHGFLDVRAALLPIGAASARMLDGSTVQLASLRHVSGQAMGDALARGLAGQQITVVDSLSGQFAVPATRLVATARPESAGAALMRGTLGADFAAERRIGTQDSPTLDSLAAIPFGDRAWQLVLVTPIDSRSDGPAGVGLRRSFALAPHTRLEIGAALYQDDGSIFGLMPAGRAEAGEVRALSLGLSHNWSRGWHLRMAAELGATRIDPPMIFASPVDASYDSYTIRLDRRDILIPGDRLELGLRLPAAIRSAEGVLRVQMQSGSPATLDLAPRNRQRDLSISYRAALSQNAEIAATVLYSDNRGNIAGLRELAGVLALQIRF